VVDSGLFCEPWPFVKIGNRVRVERGPLAGVEGLVLEIKKSYKLIISVDLLGRSVAVALDKDSVKPLPVSKPVLHSPATP
jgi:transcriptional antiterminator NusG